MDTTVPLLICYFGTIIVICLSSCGKSVIVVDTNDRHVRTKD